MSHLYKNINLYLTKEIIRRELIRYFRDYKGFQTKFNQKVFPPTIVDISTAIPRLYGKVEVVPFVNSVDPTIGSVTLGWNLFVLGTHRMFLGETIHRNSAELRNLVNGSKMIHGYDGIGRTPREIIEFIMKVLSSNLKTLKHTPTAGDINKIGQSMVSGKNFSSSGSFYAKGGMRGWR